jgi:hypothetical protein
MHVRSCVQGGVIGQARLQQNVSTLQAQRSRAQQAPLSQLLALSHRFRIAALTEAHKLLPVHVFASFLVFSSGLEEASTYLAEHLGRDSLATVKVGEFGLQAAPTVE